MKKLIFCVAAALMSVAGANAQTGKWYVGTAALSAGTYSDVGSGVFTGFAVNGNQTFIGLAPEVGYFLNDNVALGCGLGITSWDDMGTTFGINPYVRWHALRYESVSLYLQGELEYLTYSKMNSKNSFSIGVTPGVQYAFGEHFAVNASVGMFGYAKKKGSNDGVFGLMVDGTKLEFGLTYTF